MQQLDVHISIPIPADKVLVNKVELEELKRKSLSGTWWNMKDLERRLGRSHEWIKDNILYPPRFKEMLDVNNGGFVHYPENQGQVWTFQASKMTDFLEEYFGEIFTNNGRYSRTG